MRNAIPDLILLIAAIVITTSKHINITIKTF